MRRVNLVMESLPRTAVAADVCLMSNMLAEAVRGRQGEHVALPQDASIMRGRSARTMRSAEANSPPHPEPIPRYGVSVRIDGCNELPAGVVPSAAPAGWACRKTRPPRGRAPGCRGAFHRAGFARLRGAAAPGAARDRARHVRDRLGCAAALLVARVARAAARAGRSRHQHRHRPARAHRPGRDARGVPRQAHRLARARKAAATTRTSTASPASTARPDGSCCAARPSSPKGRTGGAPRVRSGWSSTSPTASTARRRTRCTPQRSSPPTMRSSRSIRRRSSRPGTAARSGSTATPPPRRSAVRSPSSVRTICTTSLPASMPGPSRASRW